MVFVFLNQTIHIDILISLVMFNQIIEIQGTFRIYIEILTFHKALFSVTAFSATRTVRSMFSPCFKYHQESSSMFVSCG
jgi:hypothetical protein